MKPTDPLPRVALIYDDDAYVEAPVVAHAEAAAGARGLMGRQVAGRSFLDAYLAHGSWSEFAALVRYPKSTESLVRRWRSRPPESGRGRTMRLLEHQAFHATFFPDPPAEVLHAPCPPDPAFAWARQHAGPGAFALSGVTHTLCSLAAVSALRELVTAPFEPFDTLICTSRAVATMVQAVTGAYADYLRDRHGGDPGVRARLATIPLGVDTDAFRPASAAERASSREAMGIDAEEVVVLFVGRLSHHAKAHPFPMFRALAEAARKTGLAIRLVLAGWASHPAIMRAFQEGARTYAPALRVDIVDGVASDSRRVVWKVADIFTSLSDNIQETFGLAVIEAMASGLPVVASDWDGYRDLIRDGETGFLIPSAAVEGATSEATSRLLLGEISYDHFLAETSQAVMVDLPSATAAYTRLIADAGLRGQMGAAARRRSLEHYTWAGVVRSYEDLWRDQEIVRRAWVGRHESLRSCPSGPAAYPSIEHTFATYPTRWLTDGHRLKAVADSGGQLDLLLQTPLTNHVSHRRSADAAVLRTILEATSAACLVGDLDKLIEQSGLSRTAGRATLAWMLKYDLLRVDRHDG